ncbi:hypothetical protein KP509_16G072700 [Ceratopteris richardii]|uniref:Uncharacterized protein n=1 Tax=Ceratopteris richardii TaxID=49495 RepID=A0A8T2SZW3_CERRI|nr:hypothetical protein KP509_16G072700 [Ceratopteris richardii]
MSFQASMIWVQGQLDSEASGKELAGPEGHSKAGAFGQEPFGNLLWAFVPYISWPPCHVPTSRHTPVPSSGHMLLFCAKQGSHRYYAHFIPYSTHSVIEAQKGVIQAQKG